MARSVCREVLVRRAAKIDQNQTEIIEGLRAIGATVEVLSAVGRGCPDILVGWRGQNTLLELKNDKKPPSQRRLTEDQVIWHATWRGQVAVVKTLIEAIEALKDGT